MNIMKNIFKKSDTLLFSFEQIEKCKNLFKLKNFYLKRVIFTLLGIDLLLIATGILFYTKILIVAFPLLISIFVIAIFYESKLAKLHDKEIENIKCDFYKLLIDNNNLLSDISQLCIDEYSETKFLNLVDCIMRQEDNGVWDKFSMLVSNYEEYKGNKEHLLQRQEFLNNLSINIATIPVKEDESYQKSAKQKLLEML